MIRYLFFILLIFSFYSAWALEFPFRNRPADAGLPGEWATSFSGSARQVGLGHTATALNGPAAAFANPASILGTSFGELNFMTAPLFSAGQFQTLSVSHRSGPRSGLGISIFQLESGHAEMTDSIGQTIGGFEEKNTMFLFSYGRRFTSWLDSGINFKLVRQSIAGYSANGYGSDVGIQIHPPIENLTLGLAFQNIIPPRLKLKEEGEKYPLVVRSGISYKFPVLRRPLLLSTDFSMLRSGNGKNPVRWGTGVEWEAFKTRGIPFLFRVGMNQREYTFGFGFRKGPFSLDYATSLHEIEILHRFGITVRFGSSSPQSESRLEKKWEEIREQQVELKRLKRGLEKERIELVQVTKRRDLKSEARLMLREGNYSEARRLIHEILKKNPKDTWAQYTLKQVDSDENDDKLINLLEEVKNYYSKEQYKKVNQIIDNNSVQLKDNSDALIYQAMSRARIYIKEEKYDMAQEQLVLVVEMDPSHEEATRLYKKIKFVMEISDE